MIKQKKPSVSLVLELCLTIITDRTDVEEKKESKKNKV